LDQSSKSNGLRSPGESQALEYSFPGPPCLNGAQLLTRREIQILALLAQGATNPEIAGTLHRSRYTVDNHVRAIVRKLGARNRTDAAVRALELGILPRARRSDTAI
jgi:DNA-binding NarL/FixJ family response regulator